MASCPERWRLIEGFEYEVSDQILATPLNIHGYPTANLYRNNVRYARTVHVLVALAFLGPRPPKMDVHHLNGRRNDGRATNLQYVTRSVNIADGYSSGRNRSGERHEWAKWSEEVVVRVRTLYTSGFGGYKAIGKHLGIPWGTVRNIVKERRWKHQARVIA